MGPFRKRFATNSAFFLNYLWFSSIYISLLWEIYFCDIRIHVEDTETNVHFC